MKAVQFSEHGDRDVISYGEFEERSPDRNEVLIDVKATALNHLDVWTRRGLPGVELDMPHVPGSDGAGVVTEVGEDVTRFNVGDRVALSAGVSCGKCEFCRDGEEPMCIDYGVIGEHMQGIQSETAVIPEENLVPVPENVEWAVAAAAPLVFQTAWRMMVTRGGLRQGESVLVHGASGGVGHAALQIANHSGCRIFVTASSDEKLRAAMKNGADVMINYEEEEFHRVVRGETDGRGVDMVVDHVGEATWQGSLKSLAKGGRLVTCGATTGGTPTTNVNRIFWNQLEVIGSTMATPGEVDDVLELVWSGDLEPEIRDVLPMSRADEGHRMLEEREGFGKVVLIPDSEM